MFEKHDLHVIEPSFYAFILPMQPKYARVGVQRKRRRHGNRTSPYEYWARYLTWKNFRSQIALYIGAIRDSSMSRLQGPGHLVVADLVTFLNDCLEANRQYYYPLLKSQMDQ